MPDTLIDLLARFARIGATPGGGVRRLTASDEDGAARALFAEEARRRGAGVQVDRIGNMFATFPLAPAATSAVLVGSHLDSQPTGGRFDGVLGVLAGLDAAAEVAARVAGGRIAARHDLTVVNWTNEEGARYQPSLTGSRVFTGAMPLAQALSLRDREGRALGDELSRIGFLGAGDFSLQARCYLELHVEQGDVLETQGMDIGIVNDSWAVRKLTLAFVGAPSHTGPTPMARRRDAMRAAAAAISRFHEIMEDAAGADTYHWSAAKIVAEPDSPNVVAHRVTVWFEMRHREMARAAAVGERVLAALRPIAARQEIGIDVVADEHRPGTTLDPALRATLMQAAQSCGLRGMAMSSITGHDALALQGALPSGLVFVPSVGGLSHTPAELTHDRDCLNGRDVLVAALSALVER
ncbi:Zn-dependent hydrolase [Frigidibacter sp. MR17.24]|uniref:Zn-dependent hydrolase n=1 Tax=Frigidibacter sp. MR17.24 TaxID=3127345 RepID=UPI003012D9A8